MEPRHRERLNDACEEEGAGQQGFEDKVLPFPNEAKEGIERCGEQGKREPGRRPSQGKIEEEPRVEREEEKGGQESSYSAAIPRLAASSL